jgi:hypothetical protein
MGDRVENAAVEVEILAAHRFDGEADLRGGLGVDSEGAAGERVAGEMDDVPGGLGGILRVEEESGVVMADGVDVALNAGCDAGQGGVHGFEQGEREPLPSCGGEVDLSGGKFVSNVGDVAEQDYAGLDSESASLFLDGRFQRAGAGEAELELERRVETAALGGHADCEFGELLVNEAADDKDADG